MKKYLIFTLLAFCTHFLYCNINEYKLEFIKSIKNGKNEGELKYQIIEQPHNPTSFAISNENLIYICDSWNKRIQIFDINLNYLKTFTDIKKIKDEIYFAFKMKIDELGNVILAENIDSFVKIDKNGNIVFSIGKKLLPDSVTNQHLFYPANNDILFYDDEDNIQMIDSQGKIKNTNDSIISVNNFDANNPTFESENKDDLEIKNYANANKLIFINRHILPDQPHKFIKHIANLFHSHNKAVNKTIGSNQNVELYSLNECIGLDSQSNTYFSATNANTYEGLIIIYSKYGELIDCFYNNFDARGIEVSPNGDLYLMKRGTENGFDFYKITRRW